MRLGRLKPCIVDVNGHRYCYHNCKHKRGGLHSGNMNSSDGFDSQPLWTVYLRCKQLIRVLDDLPPGLLVPLPLLCHLPRLPL